MGRIARMLAQAPLPSTRRCESIMIHIMKTATVRDLRTRFPEVKKLLEREGEIVVTDHGRPVIVLRPYDVRSARRPRKVNYFERLKQYMPRALSAKRRRALDEADRAER